MKHIIRYIVFVILLCVSHDTVQAQISESEVKAAYIERFTRFVEWPAIAPTDSAKIAFVIAVLGDNTFGSSLDNLFSKLKIKNLPVLLNYTKDYKNIIDSDVLIVCNSEKKELQKILEFIKSKPMLIISNSKGFAQAGTHINMYIENNNIRYEINQKAIEKTGLKINSLLLASAKIVTSDE